MMHPTRRTFLRGGASAAGAAALTGGCAGGAAADAYAAQAAQRRRALAADAGLMEFARYATLAPNGHNTQPWRFRLGESGAAILPDLTRRTPVVDPDDHHLFVSLGCAAENFLLAASARGRGGAAAFQPEGEGAVAIDLGTGPAEESPLFRAIPARQCTRAAYDGRGAPPEILRQLEQAVAAAEGVDLMLITGADRMEQILEQVIAANSAQMDDPAFVAELKRWIRFNPAAAMAAQDGLYSAASGNPTLPSWLGRRAFDLVFTKSGENDKYAEHVRSSSGVAVFVGARADKASWVQVGRAYQRFALQATALGLKHAHLNQPVEAPAARGVLAGWLGAPDRRPDLVVRFGYGEALPYSLRRPVEAVLV